jgi:hypothetical protein
MNMRKFIVLLFVLIRPSISEGQRLAQVSFLDASNISFFTVQDNEGVLIRLSVDGRLLEWGSEVMADRGYYYAPKLLPYMGRVEYYGNDVDSAYRGKVKGIGTSSITYYGSNDEPAKKGKLRMMGMLNFDYYSTYDEKSMQGKLKFIGNLLLDYYRGYENEAYRGKLKSIGNTNITYYSIFEDRYNVGKLKSIGPTAYSWYSEYDRARGSLKSNNYRQNIGGINFILR